MMVYTAKLNKKKMFAVIGVILLVILALIFGFPKKNVSQTTMKDVVLKTDEEIAVYIKELGYEVKENSFISREVTIPKKFDETYEKYNELQKEYGFDLEKYRGKRVMLYTCEILNHPESEYAILEVMIYKNKPIGGSVYTKNLDGFMYGLSKLQ